jgi:hypothetical protein
LSLTSADLPHFGVGADPDAALLGLNPGPGGTKPPDCYCYLPLYIYSGRHLLAAKQRRVDIERPPGRSRQRIVGGIHQSAVEAARGPVIDVLDAGLLAQSGLAQPGGQPLVAAMGELAIDQQPEPVAWKWL